MINRFLSSWGKNLGLNGQDWDVFITPQSGLSSHTFLMMSTNLKDCKWKLKSMRADPITVSFGHHSARRKPFSSYSM